MLKQTYLDSKIKTTTKGQYPWPASPLTGLEGQVTLAGVMVVTNSGRAVDRLHIRLQVLILREEHSALDMKITNLFLQAGNVLLFITTGKKITLIFIHFIIPYN